MKQPVGFAPKPETTALFVRVPADAAEKLDRVAFELKRPKRAIVAALLSALDLADGQLVIGRAELQRAGRGDEVLTLAQLAELLRVEEETVRDLAERGELPGRKIGGEWRFSRLAVLDWLAGRSQPP